MTCHIMNLEHEIYTYLDISIRGLAHKLLYMLLLCFIQILEGGSDFFTFPFYAVNNVQGHPVLLVIHLCASLTD